MFNLCFDLIGYDIISLISVNIVQIWDIMGFKLDQLSKCYQYLVFILLIVAFNMKILSYPLETTYFNDSR